jgi:hypothetical protein
VAGIDLADATTIDAEISGNVVLSVVADQHPLNDRDLSII